MIPSLLQAFSIENSISGEITAISRSGSQFLITLSSDNKDVTIKINTPLFLRFLDELGESELHLKLSNSALSDTDINKFISSGYSARAILTPNSGPITSTGVYSVTAFTVESQPTSLLTEDIRNYQTPPAEDWPSPEEQLPFVPVPVKHAGLDAKTHIRIGYAVFDTPIQFIDQNRTTQIEQIPTLRNQGTLKKGIGKAYESYNMSYLATGPAEIQKAVQEVFEQVSLMPFTTVEGGPFPYGEEELADIPHRAIAVRNFSVSTVDGMPNSLQVNIAFDPFMWQHYIAFSDNPDFPITSFDNTFCWPLVKIWAKKRSRSRFNNQNFNGTFNLYFPNEDQSEILNTELDYESIASNTEDLSTLKTFLEKAKVPRKNDVPSEIFSRNIKEIVDSDTEYRTFILKVDSKELFDHFQNLQDSQFFIGYLDWNYVSAKALYSDGKFLPISANISGAELVTTLLSGTPWLGTHEMREGVRPANQNYVSIPRMDKQKASLNDRIQNYILTVHGYSSLPATGTPQYASIKPIIDAAQTTPQSYFGLVLRTDQAHRQALISSVERKLSELEKENNYSYEDVSRKNKEIILKALDNASPEEMLQKAYVEVGPLGRDENIIIEKIAGNRGHNLATLSQRQDPLPIHQYMGGLDATFIVEGKCTSQAAKAKLEALKDEFDRRSLKKHSSKLSLDVESAKSYKSSAATFLYVENEIFNLLGVDFVMPVTLQFQTNDQTPGLWSFTMTFVEYNPDQKLAEEIKFLPTTWGNIGRYYEYGWKTNDNNPIADRAREFFEVDGHLALEEIYPDMKLPTNGELRFWLSALKKGALKTLARGKKNKVPKISADEQAIISLVQHDFIDHYPERISLFSDKFWDLKVEPSTFSSPDFYVWYHHDEAFGNIFDHLTENQLGLGPQKRTDGSNKGSGSLKAEGRTSSVNDPSKPPISGFREYDPTYGVKTIYSHEFWAANAEKYSIEREMVDARETHTYPQQRAAEARKAIKEAEDKMDATPGAWWPKILDKYNTSLINPGSQYFWTSDKKVAAMSEGYQSSSESISISPEMADEFKDGSAMERVFNSDLNKYFTDGWRQFIALNANKSPQRISLSVFNDYKNTKFFITDPEKLSVVDNPLRNQDFNDLSISDIERVIISYTNNRLSGAEIDLKDTGLLRYFDVPGFQSDDIFSNIGRVMQGTTRYNYPWITRFLLINKNYRANINNSSTSWNSDKTGTAGLVDSWNYIDSLGSQYNIDPNIIRSVFIRRDGFGQYTRDGSIEIGYGDFDIPRTTLEDTLRKFAVTYSKYERLGIKTPSLVLLAVNIELTAPGKKWFDADKNQVKAEVLSDLATLDKAILQSPYSPDSVKIIQSTLNKYSDAGTSIDQYYAAYLNIGRMYGSYVVPGLYSDPFFFSLNSHIVEDSKNNTETQITKFSPTGAPVAFSMSRGVLDFVDPLIQKYQGFDPNNSSIDLDVAMAKKMQAALSPHSETAIYGSLIDFRKHTPFGKLRGAFPSFQILLINEGAYWMGGSKKLWDQFYTRTGVAQIEVHKSRNQPGATASVVFSNMFHHLTQYALMEAIAHEMTIQNNKRVANLYSNPLETPGKIWNSIGQIWDSMVIKSIPEDVRKIWMNNQLKRLALGVGTRLQIRMGYGSNASKLPVVFMGNVVEVPTADGFVTITAVSDGHELEKPVTSKLINSGPSYAYSDTSPFGMGADPSLIIKGAMISATLFDNLTGGNFRDLSGGVAHFGEVIFDRNLRYSAEVEPNIYASTKTTIEQGLSELTRFQLINGLVNWGGEKNLFSVRVQEPTTWKVAEVCRHACPDFVAAAEPFAFRSTLFFGKWWWPYHHTYNPSILNLEFNHLLGYGFKSVPATENPIQKSIDGTGTLTDKSVFKDYNPTGNNLNQNTAITAQSTLAMYQFLKELGYSKSDIYNITDRFGEIPGAERDANVYGPAAKQIILKNRQILFLERDAQTGKWKLIGKPRQVQDVEFLAVKSDNSPKQPSDGLLDVKTLQMHLKWKPYFQAYIAHSAINLLDNSVVADKRKMHTDAIGIHQTNGFLSGDSVSRTIVFNLDSDIHAADRKTFMADTGIFLTGLQAGFPGVARDVLALPGKVPVLGSIAGALTDPLKDWIEQTPTTPAIENSVISALADQVKEMYQGWFTITGTPTVKPRDLFLLTDSHLDMRGPVFVKDVVHRMDAQTGFITLVSPDAVVLPHDSVVGQQIITSLITGPLHRIGAFLVSKSVMAGLWAIIKNKMTKAGALAAGANVKKLQRLRDLGYLDPTNLRMKEYFEDLGFGPGGVITKAYQEYAKDVDAEVEKLRQQRSTGLLSTFSDEDFEMAIKRLQEERAAKFMERYNEDINKLLNAKEGLKDKQDRIIQILSRELALKEELRAMDLEDVNRVRKEFELLDLGKEKRSLVSQVDAIIEIYQLPEADVDVALRKMLTFGNKGMFLDGTRVNVLKEMLDALVGTPVAYAKGVGQIANESAAALRAAKELWSSREGTAKVPSPKTSIGIRLKQYQDFINGIDGFIGPVAEGATTAEELRDIKAGVKKAIIYKPILKEAKLAGEATVNGIRLLKYMGPQAIISVVADTVMFAIGQSILEGTGARLRARQCLKILPLRVGTVPYVAGMLGHQGAVVGDDPSWADSIMMGLHGVPNNVLPAGVTTFFGFVAAFQGLEAPNYGPTEEDSKYLQKMKEQSNE